MLPDCYGHATARRGNRIRNGGRLPTASWQRQRNGTVRDQDGMTLTKPYANTLIISVMYRFYTLRNISAKFER